MNCTEKAYFEALTDLRTNDAKSLEGFALSGVKNSVVEKYSDQAHFIYELLQNADDARATSARFELFNDKLVFAHNGTRRFFVTDPGTERQDLNSGRLGDINAITAVGSSNKVDEATIGKFGVGFKAVFQYTATPHIYDQNIFFKIERFIVPVRIHEDYAGRKSNETLFVFPFDHDNRTPENSCSDISEKLRSLDCPLLFLSNLKEISFEIDGVLGLYGKNIEETHQFEDITAEFVRLSQNDGVDRNELYDDMLWLFSRHDAKGNVYSTGFFVDTKGLVVPKIHTAFCFFPTKESTALKFIVHAPFLLTDSREGIRAGSEYNIDMVSLLSDLAADSLVCMKYIGELKKARLFDDNMFDIIPYDENVFTDLNSKKSISFKPFYTAIKKKFEDEAIIPSPGGYVTRRNAYWAFVPQIAGLFSNQQLASLVENETASWVFTSFGRQDTLRKNKALTEYIDSITAGWLDEDNILGGWSSGKITPEFIEAQPLEWLHLFYQWIAETKHRTEAIRTKAVFLNQDGKAAAAFDSKDQVALFLPRDGGTSYQTINKNLLHNKTTFEFIRNIGIVEPSLRDEIYNIIIPQYRHKKNINTLPHFKKIFQYYQSCTQVEARSFLKLICEYNFVLYKLESDETQCLGKASDLYFPSEMLKKWFKFKLGIKFLSLDSYVNLVGQNNKEELIIFFRELGVKNVPKILSRKLSKDEAWKISENWHRSTKDRSWEEEYIDGSQELIEAIASEKNIELSILVWQYLLKCITSRDICKILEGKYYYFFRCRYYSTFESTCIRLLRNKKWLVNSNNEFSSAKELTKQTLHSQYEIKNGDADELLRVLRIKECEKEDIATLANQLGLSEDEQRTAFQEFAKRKQAAEKEDKYIADAIDDGFSDNVARFCSSVERVTKEVTNQAMSGLPLKNACNVKNTPTDEDDYIKPPVDLGKKIEKVKEQAEREIREIARLEDLRQQVENSDKYSFSWFRTLLELESINSGENNATSREVSISFSKVELEEGTSRTLVLKHPSRHIPQSMEDLADIPLELHFTCQPTIKLAIEVVNVKSYTLRAKLKTNAQIDGIDLSLVVEARIEAKNPVFLIEELRKSFIRLGDDNKYSKDFNMRDNLCENIEFVFGPPGTGKTTHLAKNVLLPLMQGNNDLKVLVLTPTNKASDVLVSRLMEVMGEDHSYLGWLIRFGSTNNSVIEEKGVFRDKTFDIRKLPRNVTVTTIARFPYDYFLPDDSTRLHLDSLKWDYIVIDEASMIPLVSIIYPLFKKTPVKFIIAGDPFQIEPITSIDIWKNENIYTMVELNSFVSPTTIPHQYNVTLLTTQYRSVLEIGEVFSQFAYGGVLKHFRSQKSQQLLPECSAIGMKSLNIIKFPMSKYESIYRAKKLQGKSSYQVYSALFAFELIRYLSSLIGQKNDGRMFHIGVIAPYRAQSDLIDNLMASITLPESVDVQVGTIHGFQGDECDIMLALFNPPPSISSSKDMFLNKLNIINVSISRARDYLFILMPDDNTENVANLTLIKEVERLCKNQHACSEQQAASIEKVIFGSSTYLEDNSFSTSHQLVNVYRKPEKRYEVRSEDSAVDLQLHE